MSIYAKLAKARIDLQSINISKSGLNKFAGFKYFELQDLMPHINKVMHDNGLCGVVSFEHTNAFLTIYANEGEGSIVFQSPTASATVKGATDIQCLGSMHTYLRRYLWMLALEIVEHDAIDAQPKLSEEEIAQQKEEILTGFINRIESATEKVQLDAIWLEMSDEYRNALLPKFKEKNKALQQLKAAA